MGGFVGKAVAPARDDPLADAGVPLGLLAAKQLSALSDNCCASLPPAGRTVASHQRPNSLWSSSLAGRPEAFKPPPPPLTSVF